MGKRNAIDGEDYDESLPLWMRQRLCEVKVRGAEHGFSIIIPVFRLMPRTVLLVMDTLFILISADVLLSAAREKPPNARDMAVAATAISAAAILGVGITWLKYRINVRADEGTVLIGVGNFGIAKRFRAGGVRRVELATYNGTRRHVIILSGEQEVRFGLLCSSDCCFLLVALLRERLVSVITSERVNGELARRPGFGRSPDPSVRRLVMAKSTQEMVREWNDRAARIRAGQEGFRSQNIWRNGWQDQLRSTLRSKGYESFIAWMESHPGVPYAEMVKSLGVPAAPVQLMMLQLEGAADSVVRRKIAMDMLARALNEHLVDGWKPGDESKACRARAYADWATWLRVPGKPVHPDKFNPHDTLWHVFHSLEELRPQEGWRPTGPQDPFIAEAFERGWPEHARA